MVSALVVSSHSAIITARVVGAGVVVVGDCGVELSSEMVEAGIKLH
jgi:hypothetical protein